MLTEDVTKNAHTRGATRTLTEEDVTKSVHDGEGRKTLVLKKKKRELQSYRSGSWNSMAAQNGSSINVTTLSKKKRR